MFAHQHCVSIFSIQLMQLLICLMNLLLSLILSLTRSIRLLARTELNNTSFKKARLGTILYFGLSLSLELLYSFLFFSYLSLSFLNSVSLLIYYSLGFCSSSLQLLRYREY